MNITKEDINYSIVAEQIPRNQRGISLRETAYQAIKDSILLGQLGTRVPLAEEKLAKVLAISRTPVREALALLEHEGLLEAIPYKGIFVREITVHEFIEMFDTVELIEPTLASRAAVRARPRDIESMQLALDEAKKYIPMNPGKHFLACRAFQKTLGECADHQYLTNLLLKIEERSDLYLIYTWEQLPEENMLAAIRDRQNILNAVEQGDQKAAAKAAREHARGVRNRWRKLFKDL